MLFVTILTNFVVAPTRRIEVIIPSIVMLKSPQELYSKRIYKLRMAVISIDDTKREKERERERNIANIIR